MPTYNNQTAEDMRHKIDIEALAESVAQKVLSMTKEVMTFEEAIKYTGLSKSTLYKLTSLRAIPYSKPNGKVIFFSRSQLDDWMMGCPIKTSAELNAMVQAYCMKNPLKITHK